MNQEEARNILEALADGCSPLTGEVLPLDSIVLEEEVIEALLIAIENLRGQSSGNSVEIPREELMEVVALFRQFDRSTTSGNLSQFFLGTRDFKLPELLSHPLYGRYARRFSKGELADYLERWLKAENIAPKKPLEASEKLQHPFFAEPIYNKLTEKASDQLREKVKALPMKHVENLSEALTERRKINPRSHEPWPEEESRLLKIALEYTNDLEFLASAFGRSTLSIAAQAEKFLEVKRD